MNQQADTSPQELSQNIALLITQSIEIAQEIASFSISHGRQTSADIISDRLNPELLQARTYAEIGMIQAPEVRLGIENAARTAARLTDQHPEFARLFSAIQHIREIIPKT